MGCCWSRCLSGVKAVRGILLAIAFTVSSSGTGLLSWALNIQKSTRPLTSSSRVTYTQVRYLPKAVGLASDVHSVGSVYANSTNAVGNHRFTLRAVNSLCVCSVSLEIPGCLAKPAQAQTTRMSRGSENVRLNSEWKTTYRLLEDYKETLKRIQKSVNQLLVLAHWQL